MFYLSKKKLIDFLPSVLLLILLNDKVLINGQGALVRPQEYNGAHTGSNDLSALSSKKSGSVSTGGGGGGGGGEIMKTSAMNLHEPSCEELRAMWQFSKRQSRASEITNEIPTYHDPFTYNVWDPPFFPTTTRSMGGRRISSRYRDGTPRPVYGRVVHKQPPQLQSLPIGGRYYDIPPSLDRARPSYDDIRPFENGLLGNQQQQAQQNRRNRPKVRFGNGGSGNSISGSPNVAQHAIFGSTTGLGANQIAPQRGSFQRLKQLVWTERARELEEQRKNEAIAARAAILKDITNGQHYKTSLSSQSSRRGKNGHSSNKNKLLRNENKGFDNKDDMQLISNQYWTTNDNVKRSYRQPSNGDMNENSVYSSDVSIRDYLADAAPNALDEVTYFDDDDDLVDYDINGYFNSVNQDNINDFYYYINQLLSEKPNQKQI
ncbi:CLUMA_CG018708, isoform A [Clunio marinus]|uniref:CLUMA_CG018708, isoform A n=1 Tax=Clunio marinus TaxID=568069 RepID=A0A1J1IZP5_9DIPT|nr:CLUMA_CG018708, isoform A [Clunio marinus]